MMLRGNHGGSLPNFSGELGKDVQDIRVGQGGNGEFTRDILSYPALWSHAIFISTIYSLLLGDEKLDDFGRLAQAKGKNPRPMGSGCRMATAHLGNFRI